MFNPEPLCSLRLTPNHFKPRPFRYFPVFRSGMFFVCVSAIRQTCENCGKSYGRIADLRSHLRDTPCGQILRKRMGEETDEEETKVSKQPKKRPSRPDTSPDDKPAKKKRPSSPKLATRRPSKRDPSPDDNPDDSPADVKKCTKTPPTRRSNRRDPKHADPEHDAAEDLVDAQDEVDRQFVQDEVDRQVALDPAQAAAEALVDSDDETLAAWVMATHTRRPTEPQCVGPSTSTGGSTLKKRATSSTGGSTIKTCAAVSVKSRVKALEKQIEGEETERVTWTRTSGKGKKLARKPAAAPTDSTTDHYDKSVATNSLLDHSSYFTAAEQSSTRMDCESEQETARYNRLIAKCGLSESVSVDNPWADVTVSVALPKFDPNFPKVRRIDSAGDMQSDVLDEQELGATECVLAEERSDSPSDTDDQLATALAGVALRSDLRSESGPRKSGRVHRDETRRSLCAQKRKSTPSDSAYAPSAPTESSESYTSGSSTTASTKPRSVKPRAKKMSKTPAAHSTDSSDSFESVQKKRRYTPTPTDPPHLLSADVGTCRANARIAVR
jgi:hypothetical protein